MKKYNVEDIKNQLEKLTGKTAKVSDYSPSECFLKEIIFDINNNFIMIGAFDPDNIGELDPDEDNVSLLYVYDESGRGCESRDQVVRDLYNKIKDYLIVQAGYTVVDNSDDYF